MARGLGSPLVRGLRPFGGATSSSLLAPAAPTISGTVTIGGTLTITSGGGVVSSYTLFRDSVSAGTVASGYTYVASDIGPSLTVKAVGPGGTSAASNALTFALPTANLKGSYDGTHVTLDAGRVASVLDQSAASNNLDQGTASAQPAQSIGGGANGLDAIDFALLAGNLTNVGNTNIGGGAAMSIYYLGASPADLHYIADGIVGDSRAIARNDGAGGLLMYAGSVGPAITAPATGTIIALSCIFNGASSKADINGGTTATGNVGAGTDVGLTVGSRGGGAAGTGLEQKMTRLIVYSAAHADGVRADIGAYLRYLGGL